MFAILQFNFVSQKQRNFTFCRILQKRKYIFAKMRNRFYSPDSRNSWILFPIYLILTYIYIFPVLATYGFGAGGGGDYYMYYIIQRALSLYDSHSSLFDTPFSEQSYKVKQSYNTRTDYPTNAKLILTCLNKDFLFSQIPQYIYY